MNQKGKILRALDRGAKTPRDGIDPSLGRFAPFFDEQQTQDPAVRTRQWIEIGHLCFEKCELAEAKLAFTKAYDFSQKENLSPRLRAEAIIGLLRVSNEGLDTAQIQNWESELSQLIEKHPEETPCTVWFAKGSICVVKKDFMGAQRYFHRFLRDLRKDINGFSGQERDLETARALSMLAYCARVRGNRRRARYLAEVVLSRFGKRGLRGIDGVAHVLLGSIAQEQMRFTEALSHYQIAHKAYLKEHNWYHHLYVLYGYAKVARLQQNFNLAKFYIDLVENATTDSGFEYLRREISSEKRSLDSAAVDLWVDGQKGVVKTREGGNVSLRKQYILMDILKVLSKAHNRTGMDNERGLSKAEIIEQVWHEKYRPEAHDNKLYYNINRLRKLIEPNIREPQYLLNWKEGYRLAPDLRIHMNSSSGGEL